MAYDTAIQIGSGGMGEVFKAWDPELGRWVALKYLRHVEPELVERLLREARAQARVDHPGVCQVYEVGEDDGRPYIAMQYVEGEELQVAARGMTLEQKVLLVGQVAKAVQAAHSAGLIHRDLKPGNILVGEGPDGEPRPYVLDFGIAREQAVAGLTISGQVLGTPGYLSPEQARGESSSLDRRTDVFSLGVILYELISGERPFSGVSNVESLVNLLEHDPVPLTRDSTIPRDLVTVVMTCLEKDPARRYPSARALADDLQRFLDGEPIQARAASSIERLVQRARKHPVTATALSVACLALLALVVVAVGGWIKYTADLRTERNAALAAHSEAEARELETRAIADFLAGVFTTADPDQSHGETISAREILDRGAKRIEHELDDRPAIQARLLGVIGHAYSRLGLYDHAQPLLEQALDRVLSQPDHSAEAEIEARVHLADLYRHRSQLDLAAVLVDMIPELVARTPSLDPEHAVEGLRCQANIQLYRGQVTEAEETIALAIARAQRDLPDSSLLGDLFNDKCTISADQNRWDQAIAEARRALQIRERAYGPDDPRVATTLNNLGLALRGAGRLKEAAGVGERALGLRERTLGTYHPRTSTALNNLGLVYKMLGRLDRAEELYLRSLEIRKKVYREDHPRIGAVYNNLAGIYRDRGDLDRAETTYQKALAIAEAALGPDHPGTIYARSGLALVAMMRGRYDESERLRLQDLRVREGAYGPDSPKLIGCLRALGESQLAKGKRDAALESFERARRIAAAADNDEEIAKLDAWLTKLKQRRTVSEQ